MLRRQHLMSVPHSAMGVTQRKRNARRPIPLVTCSSECAAQVTADNDRWSHLGGCKLAANCTRHADLFAMEIISKMQRSDRRPFLLPRPLKFKGEMTLRWIRT